MPLEETLGVVKEFVDAGRIESVGLSQVDVATIERGAAVLPIVAVQNEYNLGERGYDAVVDHCEEKGSPSSRSSRSAEATGRRSRRSADRYEATAQQIKLAWLLRRSSAMLPIPGTLNLDHLKGNLAALEIELSDDDYAELWPS